jgi:hypothetical protein
MGRWMMIAGLVLVCAGAVLHFAPGLPGWFGRLPGDIRIDSEQTRIYIPFTSMIIVSIVLSLLLYLFRR